MKKWRCTVCGYIHEGAEPPETCPVCGAPKEKFVPADLQPEGAGSSSDRREADVLVVGSGGAAFAAAVTARSLGASVIMLEKAATVGGTTARSGGGYWIPLNPLQREAGYSDDRGDCLRYMARYSYPHLYNPDDDLLGIPQREFSLLEAMVDNAARMVDYLDEIGALKSMLDINWTGKPQLDYQCDLPENKGIRGRTLFPQTPEGGLGMGMELIRQLEQWSRGNDIAIVTGCAVREILRDGSGRANGLMARVNGKQTIFTARQGIIFGSGGYSHNSQYMLQFQRGPHFGGCSVPTNTGDFIRMAGALGARIGNTAGAFRAQCILESALADPGGSSNVFYLIGDSMMLVNKYGQRIVNEKRNYTDRAMLHFHWDANRAEWRDMVTFLLFDQRTATLWQGYPPFPVQTDPLPGYLLKEDSLEGLAKALEQRLARLAPHTGGFALAPEFLSNLRDTVARFNRFAALGVDADFRRGQSAYDREWTTFPPTLPGADWPGETQNYTMFPLSAEGPYYCVMLAAGTLDTNGGPVVDASARVLDWNDAPIEGLYGAGNCIASPTANAYWGGGSTIGPGMTFGYIAAKHCVGLEKK